ncbi:MAG: hypothetical protein HY050_08055 [Actinobacteria bacterium]|nr:hypothetical protein [Actinomycetota bacterium]
MIFGALFPIALLILVIVVIRRFAGRNGNGTVSGNSVRRFFQYVLLFGLLVVAGIGLSGLLGRLLRGATLVVSDQTALARNFSFVVVGVPLLFVLSIWTRRKFLAEPSEANSFGWGFYITLSSITALAVAMFALHDILIWTVGSEKYNGESLARFLVWGAIWGVHWRVDIRVTPAQWARYHHLLGSLIGLGTVVAGLSDLLSEVIARIFHLGGAALFLRGGDSILLSAVSLVVGIPVWLHYWIRTYAKSKRDSLWLGYVLLAGVGGGLVIAVSFASAVLYQILVWFIGDPTSTEAAFHFQNVSTYSGAALVGVISWWYHHAILEEVRATTRTEAQRIYEYLMAGIGLVAATGGIGMLLTAMLEAITSSAVIVGGATNALLAAGTLLVVGGPVWWIFWSRIQTATHNSPSTEHTSATRRIYLFILFGVGGLTGVVALLDGVFYLFDDIFKGNFSADTVHRARYSISVLLTAFAVAGYHWMIYQSEREFVQATQKGPNFILLIGKKDPELIRAISQYTGARVQAWERLDDVSEFGSLDAVLKTLDGVEEENVILLAEASGLRAIPIERN